jgi:hypothetical protein
LKRKTLGHCFCPYFDLRTGRNPVLGFDFDLRTGGDPVLGLDFDLRTGRDPFLGLDYFTL